MASKNKHILYMLRYYCCNSNKLRGQHRKRAEEKIANDSALATEPEGHAKVSAAIETIENRAPRAAPCHSVIPTSGIRRSGTCGKRNLKSQNIFNCAAVASNCRAISSDAKTVESQGGNERNCSAAKSKAANEPNFRQAFLVQHRGVT